jgi:hypothetical protein
MARPLDGAPPQLLDRELAHRAVLDELRREGEDAVDEVVELRGLGVLDHEHDVGVRVLDEVLLQHVDDAGRRDAVLLGKGFDRIDGDADLVGQRVLDALVEPLDLRHVGVEVDHEGLVGREVARLVGGGVGRLLRLEEPADARELGAVDDVGRVHALEEAELAQQHLGGLELARRGRAPNRGLPLGALGLCVRPPAERVEERARRREEPLRALLLDEPWELGEQCPVGDPRREVEVPLEAVDRLEQLERKGRLPGAGRALDQQRVAAGVAEELDDLGRQPAHGPLVLDVGAGWLHANRRAAEAARLDNRGGRALFKRSSPRIRPVNSAGGCPWARAESRTPPSLGRARRARMRAHARATVRRVRPPIFIKERRGIKRASEVGWVVCSKKFRNSLACRSTRTRACSSGT